MSQFIRCPQCRAVLNVPAQSAARRLKCPSCRTRFAVNELGVAVVLGDDQPDRSASSSVTVSLEPVKPEPRRDRVAAPELPADAGDGEANAALFFRDDSEPERPISAGYRQPVSVCPNCGGPNAIGSAVCGRCGAGTAVGPTQESVQLVEPLDVPLAPAPEISASALVVGWGSAIIGIGLIVASAVGLMGSTGALLAGPTGLFLTYAALLYLYGRAYKRLLVGLSLAAFCVLLFVMVVPVVQSTVLGPRAEGGTSPTGRARPGDHQLVAGAAAVVLIGFMLMFLSTRAGRAYVVACRSRESDAES